MKTVEIIDRPTQKSKIKNENFSHYLPILSADIPEKNSNVLNKWWKQLLENIVSIDLFDKKTKEFNWNFV